jgi:hypothetical protein
MKTLQEKADFSLRGTAARIARKGERLCSYYNTGSDLPLDEFTKSPFLLQLGVVYWLV